MDAKKLIELRKQAEKAVADMDDGDMKVKAFEVILSQLLAATKAGPSVSGSGTRAEKRKTVEKQREATSIGGRILVLREEKFFSSQKTIGDVRNELAAHGWHYATTALSGALQDLVRKRELRREKVKVKDRNKPVWKYSNP